MAISALVAHRGESHAQTVTFQDGPDGKPMTSRFIFMRVRAAHHWHSGCAQEPREEWLIGEWPEGRDEPTDYRELGPDWQKKRYSPEHRARRLRRQLEALGYQVTLSQAPATA